MLPPYKPGILYPAYPVKSPILLPVALSRSSMDATSCALGTTPPPRCQALLTTTYAAFHDPNGPTPFRNAGTKTHFLKKWPLPSLTQCPAVVMIRGRWTVAEQT